MISITKMTIKSESKKYNLAEEIASSITHGIGVALSIAGLTVSLVFASLYGNAWHIVGFCIFGISLILLYTSSTLYHGFQNPKIKHIFRVIDYSAIYVLIAGSYTPVILISMRNTLGFTLLGLVWGMAFLGIILKVLFFKKLQIVAVAFYLLMGWMIVFVVKPALVVVPRGLFYWLLAGGLCYTIGVIFFALKKIPFNHTIWHFFVLGGSTLHFLGMFFYLI